MELKEGMYVRTNEGKITKIIEIDKDGFERVDKCIDFTNYNITKASHNIIDLIEVDDYVNGYKVRGTSVSTLLLDNFNMIKIEDYEIKSIVTKEQFESMSYKVGE